MDIPKPGEGDVDIGMFTNGQRPSKQMDLEHRGLTGIYRSKHIPSLLGMLSLALDYLYICAY